ncbi:hypothetical protein ACSNOI_18645 [Actinomadura kijaniata]|uniref:hypothetical protein n=1 Tax=Actinomadura kijaniata TaxID=46161 RepID=UPI003F1B0177
MRMIERLLVKEYAFFTPDKLGGGQLGYENVCALCGLKPRPDGYGALLLASVDTNQHATFVTWDTDWVRTVAEVAQQMAAGEITAEAGGMDLSPLYGGWPDEWDGCSPRGGIVAAYRGLLPYPDNRT